MRKSPVLEHVGGRAALRLDVGNDLDSGRKSGGGRHAIVQRMGRLISAARTAANYRRDNADRNHTIPPLSTSTI